MRGTLTVGKGRGKKVNGEPHLFREQRFLLKCRGEWEGLKGDKGRYILDGKGTERWGEVGEGRKARDVESKR